ESPGMVCSEVVYRAWADCAADPRGRLALRIVEGERGTAPFPAIDWQARIDEIGPLLLPRQAAALVAGRGMAAPVALEELLTAEAPVGDEELAQARLPVLASLAGGALLRGSDPGLVSDPRPNPRLVSPKDLANSPGV